MSLTKQPHECHHGQWDANTDTCTQCGMPYEQWRAEVQQEISEMHPIPDFEEQSVPQIAGTCQCEMLFKYGHKNDCPEKKS